MTFGDHHINNKRRLVKWPEHAYALTDLPSIIPDRDELASGAAITADDLYAVLLLQFKVSETG